MPQLMKGAPVAAALNETTAGLCAGLAQRGVTPTLAVVRVGEREDDLAYERGLLARCAKVGVAVRCLPLPSQVSQAHLMEQLRQVNQDSGIHGCLLLRPLPAGLDEEAARNVLDPAKDVDGITDASLAGLVSGSGRGFAPCTAQACLEVLRYYQVPLEGRRAVVVGRSLVVGRPAALLLDRANATVTVCHSRTRDLPALCRQADVLVAALGRAQALGADCFRPGQVVVDVGIHVGAEGKLCGDICQADAQQADICFTPVPGGVGAVTTAVLALHVARAAQRSSNSD